MMNAIEQALQHKWQDYLFLTQEMKKFIQSQDFDMFFSLMNQRGMLQELILQEAKQGHPYYQLEESRTLLRQIEQANQAMMQVFLLVFHAMRRRETVSNAYEGGSNTAGQYLNRNT
ncbi:MAG: hypothetical protein E6713_01155 [Sporomusaceae bacterium]|nr:hypothetical protein [Sporomusaceae bacterium]